MLNNTKLQNLQCAISAAELAELSTNPAVVWTANPRLKPQTISGSIAQVRVDVRPVI